MATTQSLTGTNLKHSINLSHKDILANKEAYYAWLRQEAPVYNGKMSVITAYFLSRYEQSIEGVNE